MDTNEIIGITAFFQNHYEGLLWMMLFALPYKEILLFTIQTQNQVYWENAIMRCMILLKEMTELLNVELEMV